MAFYLSATKEDEEHLTLEDGVKYKLGRYIGGGQSGAVYEAIDIASQEPYAIKVLQKINYKLTSWYHLSRCIVLHRGEPLTCQQIRGLSLAPTVFLPSLSPIDQYLTELYGSDDTLEPPQVAEGHPNVTESNCDGTPDYRSEAPLATENVWWLFNPTKNELIAAYEDPRGSTPTPESTKNALMLSERFYSEKKLGKIPKPPPLGNIRELPLPMCMQIWGLHPPEAKLPPLVPWLGKPTTSKSEASPGIFAQAKRPNPNKGSNNQIDASNNTNDADSGTVTNVFKITSLPDGRQVALPRVPRKYIRFLKDRRKLQREVLSMLLVSSVPHPNILTLIGVGDCVMDNGNVLYLILELAHGGDLFSILSTQKIDKETAIRCTQQLLDAVSHIHSLGLVHRDLKPENILFQDEETHTRMMKRSNATLYPADSKIPPLSLPPTHVSPSNASRNRDETFVDHNPNSLSMIGVATSFGVLKIADFGLSSIVTRELPTPLTPYSPFCQPATTATPIPAMSLSAASPSILSGASPHLQSRQNSSKNLHSNFIRLVSTEQNSSCSPSPFSSPFPSPLSCPIGSPSSTPLLRLQTTVGSPYYAAPEVWKLLKHLQTPRSTQAPTRNREASYDGISADVWSLGVITYTLLVGNPPFGPELLTCKLWREFCDWIGEFDKHTSSKLSNTFGMEKIHTESKMGAIPDATPRDPQADYSIHAGVPKDVALLQAMEQDTPQAKKETDLTSLDPEVAPSPLLSSSCVSSFPDKRGSDGVCSMDFECNSASQEDLRVAEEEMLLSMKLQKYLKGTSCPTSPSQRHLQDTVVTRPSKLDISNADPRLFDSPSDKDWKENQSNTDVDSLLPIDDDQTPLYQTAIPFLFSAEESGELKCKIVTNPVNCIPPPPKIFFASALSPLSRDFIIGLLHPDPNRRPTIREALSHPWILGEEAVLTAPCDPSRLFFAACQSSNLTMNGSLSTNSYTQSSSLLSSINNQGSSQSNSGMMLLSALRNKLDSHGSKDTSNSSVKEPDLNANDSHGRLSDDNIFRKS